MKTTFNPSYRSYGASLRTPAAPSIPDADPVFSVGDMVMHPSEGVCAIKELRRMDLSGAQHTYYILKPNAEKNSSTVYMPVARGNTILRKLLTREDILALIRQSKEYADLWIADSKQRKDAFSRILAEGNHAKVIRMVEELHIHSAERAAEGKKPCATDQAILAEAERLLHQEFSYVLHMSIEETVAFIKSELHV